MSKGQKGASLLDRWQSVLALAVVCFLLQSCSQDLEWTATDISGLMPNLQLELTSDEGRAVNQDEFLGKTNIVFFGFTYCPDICPTTLAKVRQAIHQLSEEQRQQLNVLFISVDPERDTPEHLKRYISSFGPEFKGLTGTQEQLKSLVRNYRVTYGYGKPDEDGNYDVSHSSAIFIFDPSGAVRLLAKDSIPTEGLAQDLERLMETS